MGILIEYEIKQWRKYIMFRKKVFVIIIFIALIHTLSACDNKNASQGDNSSGVTTPFETAQQETTASHVDYSKDWNYTYDEYLKGILISSYKGYDTEIVIPSEIDGNPVVAIGNRKTAISFIKDERLLKDITSVIIPDGVIEIYASAFDGCTSITSITIPDGVTEIRSWAFKDCTGLTSVEIPNSVTKISKEAFYGCTGLKNIIIPNNVKEIGSSAFFECTGLTSITIPCNATEICSYTFSGCTGLTSIIIPDNVTKIDSSAFKDCTGLTSITIPDSVTEIGTSAFADCTGLTSVIIGNGVKEVSGLAFKGCTELASVTILAKSNEVKINMFAFADSVEINYQNG